MRISANRELAVLVFLLGIISLLSSVILLENVEITEFHGDESAWISVGYYYADLLLKLDFEWGKWECDQCGNWASWLTVNLGKLLIGIPLRMNSQTVDKWFFDFYYFDRTLEWNRSVGKVPSRNILLPARCHSVFFGTLSCIIVFAIGSCSSNRWIGVIATILLLANRLFVESATRAMTDVHYNLFLLSVCLATIPVLRPGNGKSVVLRCCLCGCLAGIAGSVKVSGVVLEGLFFLMVVVYESALLKPRIRETLLYLTAFCFSAIVMIYVLNPYFWPSLRQSSGQALAREVVAFPRDDIGPQLQLEDVKERFLSF
jgi:hypothetical protein